MRDIDRLARLSDDTFAILLPGGLARDGATIAERIRQGIERRPLPRKAGARSMTVSAGVVQTDKADDLRRLLQRARGSLSSAVNAGRNRVAHAELRGVPTRDAELAVK